MPLGADWVPGCKGSNFGGPAFCLMDFVIGGILILIGASFSFCDMGVRNMGHQQSFMQHDRLPNFVSGGMQHISWGCFGARWHLIAWFAKGFCQKGCQMLDRVLPVEGLEFGCVQAVSLPAAVRLQSRFCPGIMVVLGIVISLFSSLGCGLTSYLIDLVICRALMSVGIFFCLGYDLGVRNMGCEQSFVQHDRLPNFVSGGMPTSWGSFEALCPFIARFAKVFCQKGRQVHDRVLPVGGLEFGCVQVVSLLAAFWPHSIFSLGILVALVVIISWISLLSFGGIVLHPFAWLPKVLCNTDCTALDRVLPVGGLDFGCVKVVSRPAAVRSTSRFCPGIVKVLGLISFVSSFRIGEATNPGPPEDVWSLGVFNPSGLNSKVDLVSNMDGDIWLGSETHLSQVGFGKFRAGLRSLGSSFQSVIQGAPCALRSTSGVGTFSGVIALSKFPAKALPHQFCPEQFATSRIQVVGACVNGLWIQLGVMYGYPDSVQYRARSFHTDCLLDQLVTRIGCEATGPRAIGGDFNHGPQGLAQLARLHDLGFREIQDVALTRWGTPVAPTGRGQDNIDQLWISPELQSLLVQVQIDDTHWASHSTVMAFFQSNVAPLRHFHWFQPSSFPWPDTWKAQVPEWTSDLSFQYAQFWHLQEEAASCELQTKVPLKCFGRGQTLDTQTQLANWAPVPKARQGDAQPSYFGTSKQHYLQFRQLRRIQSLLRMLQSSSVVPMHQVKKCELWSAIRHASGFGDSFETWWIQNFGFELCPVGFSNSLPDVAFVSQLFEQFQGYMGKFEAQLGASRFQAAKEKRATDVRYVFQDLAREAPERVDTLIHSRSVEIDQLCPEDCSIILREPTVLIPDLPLVSQGKSFPVIMADHDQIWLESLDDLQPGSVLRQEEIFTSDEAILQQFAKVWEPRWNKASHVAASQWAQISSFIEAQFRPIEWHFSPWTGSDILRIARQKKAKSATGPDGVSRGDILSLPLPALNSIAELFQAVESTGRWPCQLLQGQVSGLSKGRGEGVDSFRPVTIFPFLTRVWSTGRAREAMKCLMPSLPASVRGAVPDQHAKQIWFEIAQRIEHSYACNCPLQGILLDVQRAFNALPRDPIWSLLTALDAPQWFVRSWAAFLAGQNRRFRARSSVGEPLFSTVGFPEGCALSVIAMSLLDWILDRWLTSMICDPHELVTYVDDWHVIYQDIDAFDRLWNAVQSFAVATDLTIDDQKSLLWASHSGARSTLRKNGNSVSLAARNLGAHQNFCLRRGNQTLLARLDQMQVVWVKLKACLSPYRLKVMGLLQLAWARAFFGISVVHLGHHHLTKLRTGASRGLKVDRVGSNPMLHLSSNGFQVDPEGFCIAQTLREVREVGNIDWMKNAWQLLWAMARAGSWSHGSLVWDGVFNPQGIVWICSGPFARFQSLGMI